jgi:hypothetical protein
VALKLITADQRIAEQNVKVTMAIFGRPKIGKTSLLYTMPEDSTLFLDLEAGMKSVQEWRGDSIQIRSWVDAINIACLIGGVDPSSASDDNYSEAHHEAVVNEYGHMINPDKYRTVFTDSITELTRLAMTWSKSQPAAFSERTGKPDIRGAYGLLGREVVRLLKHIQHAPGKNAIFVGGLGRKVDDFNRETWEPQTEGGKTSAELPFIVDQIVTYSDFDYSDVAGWQHNFGKGEHRALCCRSPNPWGLPGGDRSGNLDLIEEPHLGRLIEKINKPSRPVSERLVFSRPDHSPT